MTRTTLATTFLALTALHQIILPSAAAAQSEPLSSQTTAKQSKNHSDKISAIERGLRPALGAKGEPGPVWTLQERMVHHRVPAISIAVAINGELVWAKAYGVAEKGGADAVDTETLFQAASLSKPVAALAALTLVDEGRVELDAPVNDYLSSWKIPDNAYTKQRAVTLRHLLSHRAGTTVHGFRGYDIAELYPSSVQVLTGDPPANASPIVVDKVPGESRRYSGGGYQVVQLLIEDVATTPFAEYVKTHVLEPAGLSRSNYEYVQSGTNVAHGHLGKSSQPMEGHGYYAYPEMAAAGLWTTPSELVLLGSNVAAARNTGQGLVSKRLAGQLVPESAEDPGLGFGLNDPGDGVVFVHNGHNPGYSARWFNYADGKASVAILTNSDTGGDLIREVASAIGYVYGWQQDAFEERETIPLPTQWQSEIVGGYAFDAGSSDPIATIEIEDDMLWIEGEITERSPFYPTSRTDFFIPSGLNFVIETGPDGGVEALDIEGELRLVKMD